MVDIDPQTNLTFLCAPYDKWKEVKQRTGTINTMYQRYLERKPIDTTRYIWKAPIKVGKQTISNLDLIPCDIDLLGEDLGGGQVSGTFPTMELLRRQNAEYLRERMFMRKALHEVEDKYDYILIDCPPNLYLMAQNALAASNWYVITAIPDHLSTIGLNILQQKVERIGEYLKSAETFAGEKNNIKIAKMGGVVFVRVRIGGTMLTNVHAGTMVNVRNLVGAANCFGTYTTELIGYSEAAENSAPIWMLATVNCQRAAAKREYELITQEFVQRF